MTQKLNEHINKPLHFDPKAKDDFDYYTTVLGAIISFKVECDMFNGENCLIKVRYFTAISSESLGLIDAFISLILGKPVDVLDRVTPRELDYYLRDTTDKASFEYYTDELFKIIGLGEFLYKSISGIDEKRYRLIDETGQLFFDLSFSEQVELVEEFSSKYIYPRTNFLELDVSDIEDGILHLSVSDHNELKKFDKLLADLSYELGIDLQSIKLTN